MNDSDVDSNTVMNKKTLVLNKDYRPLQLIPATRAFTMWFRNRVDVVHHYDSDDVRLRTPHVCFQVPSVVRVKKYVDIPHKDAPLTRQNIYKRDNNTCVYCGSGSDLTLDHVTPQSRGGKNTWKNLVTACKTCNHEKSDKMIDPDSVNAYRPNYYFLVQTPVQYEEDWKPYLFC